MPAEMYTVFRNSIRSGPLPPALHRSAPSASRQSTNLPTIHHSASGRSPSIQLCLTSPHPYPRLPSHPSINQSLPTKNQTFSPPAATTLLSKPSCSPPKSEPCSRSSSCSRPPAFSGLMSSARLAGVFPKSTSISSRLRPAVYKKRKRKGRC